MWFVIAFTATFYFLNVRVLSKFAYVGTYGPPNGTGKGIYVYNIDPNNKSWYLIQQIDTPSPSFLVMNRKQDRLYSTNEVATTEWEEGRVSAFKIDSSTGKLTFLNSQPSGGNWPCYVNLDPDERFLLVANYRSGTVIVYRLNQDGSIGNRTFLLTHRGCGPNKERQEQAHAHLLLFPPKIKCLQPLLVVDLGLDRVISYEFDDKNGIIRDNVLATWISSPGSGPRHAVLSRDSRFLYVINELFSTVDVFPYVLQKDIKSIQTVSTLPSDMCNVGSNSGIMFHPTLQVLYAANRFNDIMSIYCVNPDTGVLAIEAYQSTLGKTPRHFQIDCDYMYVGNQESNTINVFHIQPQSGILNNVGMVINSPSPAMILFKH